MNLKRLLLFASIFCCFSAKAQLSEIASSDAFDQPKHGFLKIINNSKGETFYIKIDSKEGMDVKKYDINHKLVTAKNLKTLYGKLRFGELLGVYEINHDIAVFTLDAEGMTPKLYRQIIDEDNCTFKEEILLDSLPHISLGNRLFSHGLTTGSLNDIFMYKMKKDPYSDNYVILAHDLIPNSEIKFVFKFYNGKHELISKANFTTNDQKFGDYQFKDMAIVGDKKVIVAVVGTSLRANTAKGYGKLLIGTLNAGANSFEISQEEFPSATDISGAVLKYSRDANKCFLLCLKETMVEKKKTFLSYLSTYDPDTKAFSSQMINTAAFTQASGKRKWGDQSLKPVAQNFILSKDGGFDVVFEDMDFNITTQRDFEKGTLGMTHMYMKLFLNDLAVVHYDKNNQVTASDIIPKSYQMKDAYNFYNHNQFIESGVNLDKGAPFQSVFYFHQANKRFILYNDDERNEERIADDKKPELVADMDNSYAYAAPLGLDKNAPFSRSLVFKGSDKKHRYIAMFGISAYDENTHTLATLKVNEKAEEASVVWLKAD